MKNIVSFSLWGDLPRYTQGAIENSIQYPNIFKDWICRFYVHKDVNINIINSLKENNAEIIIIDDDLSKDVKGNYIGWFWRFKALSDKNIDRVIIRDTDSRPSIREKNCIKDWIASEKEFHIIRDHIMHGVPICAGMWGATKNFMEKINIEKLIMDFKSPHNPIYGGYDQHFLAEQIYPLIKDIACIHSDLIFYKDEKIRPIPHILINDDHIGKPIFK